MKLPQTCSKCGKPVYNYTLYCGACGYMPPTEAADRLTAARNETATLRAENARLRSLLKQAADDLRYASTLFGDLNDHAQAEWFNNVAAKRAEVSDGE